MNFSRAIKSSRSFVTLCLLFTGLSLVLSTERSAAQNVSRRDTIRRMSDTAVSRIEEQLVALALRGPEATRMEHQNKVYEYQLKSAKNSWMNFLTLSVNYNDQTLAQSQNPNAQYVYPKYFFGLNVPLGTFISSKQTKIAKESVEIGKASQEELRRKIRADVISKYRQYRSYSELMRLQGELLNDVQAALLQTEDKFRKGTISFDLYNAAQKMKNDEVSRLINLQLEQDLIKIEIERMIGTSLESVTG